MADKGATEPVNKRVMRNTLSYPHILFNSRPVDNPCKRYAKPSFHKMFQLIHGDISPTILGVLDISKLFLNVEDAEFLQVVEICFLLKCSMLTSFVLPAAVNPEFNLYHRKQKQFANAIHTVVCPLHATCVSGCLEIS